MICVVEGVHGGTNMDIVLGSGLVGGGNPYLCIQGVSAEQLVSPTHVDVCLYQGSKDCPQTGIFIPKRHPFEGLGEESQLVSEGWKGLKGY